MLVLKESDKRIDYIIGKITAQGESIESNLSQERIQNVSQRELQNIRERIGYLDDITDIKMGFRYLIIYGFFISLVFVAITYNAIKRLIKWQTDKTLKPVIDSIETQNRFITDAGHELKTPISVIKLCLESLQENCPESCREWVENIQKETENMTELVFELIELAKAEEKLNVEIPERFSIGEDFYNFIGEAEEVLDIKGVILSDNIDQGAELTWYPEEFHKIIKIFINNMIKYALPQTEAKVSLEETPNGVEIKFINICKELPDCEPNDLFKRFFQGNSSRNKTENSGYGIGLSIAQAIVEKTGGEVFAKFNEGNRITFTIKLNDVKGV